MILCRTFYLVLVCLFVFPISYSKAGILIPGDYDANGLVDVVDVLIWEDTYGSTTFLEADGNQNGIVDQADYDLIYANFGQTGFLTAGISEAALGMAESVVSLIYDPNSGAVVIDPDNSLERIYAFKLITSGSFNQGVANAPFQRFVADPNGVLPDGDTFVETETEIGQIAIGGNGLSDEGANLGPILPTGLSASELQAQLGGSQIFGGGGGQPLSIEFVEVPEPATLWGIVVLGGIVLVMRRRSTNGSFR